MGPSYPQIYTLQGQSLLEAAMVNTPDVIDFGSPGLQVTSTQFVGVRFVGSGIVVESPRVSSHHGVSDLLKGMLGTRKASQEKELNLRFGDLRTNLFPEFMQQDHSDRVTGDMKRSKTTLDFPKSHSRYCTEYYQRQERGDEMFQKEKRCEPGSPGNCDEEIEVHTWELVWKEGKASGPLRRLKFVTSKSGYQFIQNILDAWASASHTSSAMNQAAKAALDACGGHLKENHVIRQDLDTDGFVTVKCNDDDAMDHIDLANIHLNLNRDSEANALVEQKYQHAQHVINMQSIQLQGKIHPHCDSRSSILEDGHIMALAAVLPVRFRSYNWTLLYSTSRDGISLNTLYRKVHMNGPTILVIRDWHKKVFGCYASEEWKVSGRSYGTGECFVFQLVPDMKAYKWTRVNNMFMFSNMDTLAIGGGDHYSILLNSDLLTGYSGACETFGSPALASSEEFEVSAVEAWGFQ